MDGPELLLDTLVWAVHRMRELQKQVWSPTSHPDLVEVVAAEREVDELVALHTLPTILPINPEEGQ